MGKRDKTIDKLIQLLCLGFFNAIHHYFYMPFCMDVKVSASASLSGGILFRIITYLTKTVYKTQMTSWIKLVAASLLQLQSKPCRKIKAMAVAITHFTASEMMELNVVMIESFRDSYTSLSLPTKC